MSRKMSYPTAADQAEVCGKIAAMFHTDIVTRTQLLEFQTKTGLPFPYFLTHEKSRNAGWGKYRLTATASQVAEAVTAEVVNPAMVSSVSPQQADVDDDANVILEASDRFQKESFIPVTDPTFVPFGFYDDLVRIIESKIFYPMYLTGLSGNGKTLSVIQACAQLARELIRVNITKDTDELDLFGSHELINGDTVRKEGPVLTAMHRGAILLLDETDYGSERLLCLQPVLEGKPFLDKKTNTVVYPMPGFNVIACANTKGKGSNDGRFIGANILNEAFLERFAITIEQEYPNAKTEIKILQKNFEEMGERSPANDRFAKHLVTWSEMIRKTYFDGSIDEVISTRRLVHIVKAHKIFKDRKKAIRLCLNRFDDETKMGMIDVYNKLDADDELGEAPAPEANHAPSGTTTKASGGKSDPEFLPTASVLTHKYKTQVVLRRDTVDNSVLVESHGCATKMPPQTSSLTSKEFQDKVARCVEANQLESSDKMPF